MTPFDVRAPLLRVPRRRIVIRTDLNWPASLSCRIGLGGCAVPGTPPLAVQLHFIKRGSLRDIAFFTNAPPLEPLQSVGLDAATLLGYAGDENRDRFRALIDLVGNRVYTPLAGIEIFEKKLLHLRLTIGDWQGLFSIQRDSFKTSLRL